mgnify:CR=1 FL=1
MESDSVSYRLPGIRTFECVVGITGWPKSFPDNGVGKMEDLPENIQDGVYKAMELKSKQLNMPLAVVLLRIDEDHDVPKDAPGHFFLHIILSEVVTISTDTTRH